MGLFDMVCKVTGLAGQFGAARLILTAENPTGWEPLGLPVAGSYDGYGKIDSIQVDPNVRALHSHFTRARDAGLLTCDGPNLEGTLKTFELLLEDVSQGMADSTYVTLAGRRVGFVLILEEVYVAILKMTAKNVAGLKGKTLDPLIAAAFPGSEAAWSIYSTAAPSLAKPLKEFAAFRTFKQDGFDFSPQKDLGGQSLPDEQLKIPARAKAKFKAFPALTRIIATYEAKARRDQEEDDEE